MLDYFCLDLLDFFLTELLARTFPVTHLVKQKAERPTEKMEKNKMVGMPNPRRKPRVNIDVVFKVGCNFWGYSYMQVGLQKTKWAISNPIHEQSPCLYGLECNGRWPPDILFGAVST